jgi:uncharacterized protein (TIGR03435 family)
MLGSRYSAIVPVFKAFLLVGLAIVSTVSASAQSTSAPHAQPAPKFTYEVVSITPSKPGVQGSLWRRPPNGIVITNWPLGWLVRSAYKIINDDQLAGMPSWADSDRYDIQAKMDEEATAAWKNLSQQEQERQNGLMLQLLLADRCGLKVHRETKQLPVFNLVIAKGGSKLNEAKAAQGSRMMSNYGVFEAESMSIESLVNNLSNSVGRVVIDQTGLGNKKFDLKLKWTPDEQQGTADAGPSLYTALEEQLGLKLVAARAPVEVIVVDQMDKPSPN